MIFIEFGLLRSLYCKNILLTCWRALKSYKFGNLTTYICKDNSWIHGKCRHVFLRFLTFLIFISTFIASMLETAVVAELRVHKRMQTSNKADRECSWLATTFLRGSRNFEPSHGIWYWPVIVFVFQFKSKFTTLSDKTANLPKSTDHFSNRRNYCNTKTYSHHRRGIINAYRAFDRQTERLFVP